MKKLYLQLNQPGFGELTVPPDSPLAAQIISGNYIDLKYRGDVLGGFWVEHIDKDDLSPGENGARTISGKGRGTLAILDHAHVYDWMTPDLETTRYYWLNIDGTVPAMMKKGIILHQLIHEAMDPQYNAVGDLMDRKVFRDAAGNALLTFDFTDTLDSDGIPWDIDEVEYIQARVGTSYLDMVRQFCELGQPTAGYVFDVNAIHDAATGITALHVHQTPIGISLANANIHFRKGFNCTEVSESEDIAELRNAVLVEYANPTNPYIEVNDPASIAIYGRREVVLQAANASEVATAQIYGNSALTSSKVPKHAIKIKVSDAVGPKLLIDYNLGDWIYYDNNLVTEIPYRIVALSPEWDDDNDKDAEVEITLNSLFMEIEIRNARDLRRIGAQMSGSSLMAPRDPNASIYGALLHIPSGDAADGQVLTADGLGSSDWENVDGGHGTPGGVEHLKALLHFDGANGSQVFDDELGNVWTAHNHAQLSDGEIKFGLSSGLFDGVDDYIEATVPAMGSGDFTYESWIFVTALPPHPYYAGIFSTIGPNWYGFGVGAAIDEVGHICIFSPNWADNWGPIINTIQQVSLNHWHHFAVVCYSGVWSVYLDGIKDANTVTHSYNLTGTDMYIGLLNVYSYGPCFWKGYTDEFAAFDYAKYLTHFHTSLPTQPYTLVDQVVRGTTILFRRGDIANIPTLYDGEPFIALDTGALHIGAFIVAPGSGGYGDIIGTGVVGQLAEFVTDTKHIQAAKIIGPTTNILTITNAAAATLALNITAGKTLTLTTVDDFNLTIPTTGTVALLATANVFTNQQMIDGTSDQNQLRVQGHSTQTAHLQTWEDSSSITIAYIDAKGGIGAMPVYTDTGATQNNGLYGKLIVVASTADITGIQRGLNFSAILDGTYNFTAEFRGGDFLATTKSTFTGVASAITGFVMAAGNASNTGTITTVNALKLTHYSTGIGAITNFYALHVSNFGGTNVTNAYGIMLDSDTTAAGTLKYGIKIGNLSGSTTNYAIYTGNGLNLLGDQLSIIGSQDIQQSIVKGFSTQTTNLQEWRQSTGTVLASISPLGKIGFPIGSEALPGLYPLGDPSTGWFQSAAGLICLSVSGNRMLRIGANLFAWGQGDVGTSSALTVRGAAASGINLAGANITFDASNGTGSGGSGDFIWRVAPVGSGTGTIIADTTSLSPIKTSPGSNLTWSHVMGSGSQGILIVTVSWRNNSSQTISSVTCAGSAMTLVPGSTATNSTNCVTEMYYILAPAAGANTILITFSAAALCTAGASSWFCVNQTTPFGTAVVATGSTNASSVTVTSAAGEVVVDSLAKENSTEAPSVGGGQTQLYNQCCNNATVDNNVFNCSSWAAGAASVVMAWSWTTAKQWAASGVPLKPGLSITGNTLAEVCRITHAGRVGIGVMAPASRLDIGMGAITLKEMTAPAAPAADNVVIYAEDNGAGKTRLMALFNTGAAQQIAIQP
jgi:hypothetical protein